MKVAGYGRVSTLKQAMEGTSMEAQQEAIRRECEAKGYELTRFYHDDGFSGKSVKNRPGLQQLLQDAKAGKFQLVMFTKLDRLGRNLRDLLNVWNLLQEEHGLDLYCIQEPMVNSNSKLGKVMLHLLGAFAEFERETIRERTQLGRKKVWQEQKKVIGTLPFGYQFNNDTGEIEINSEQEEIYNYIVRLYLDERLSFQQIALRLTEEQVPPPSAGWKRKAKRWSAAQVGKILKHPAYTGTWVQNKYKYEGAVSTTNGTPYMFKGKEQKPEDEWITIELPALITEERWKAIQSRIEHNRRKPKKPYKKYRDKFLVDGLLYCGLCGARVQKVVDRDKYFLYVCPWKKAGERTLAECGKQKCSSKFVNADRVDDMVLKQVADVITNPGRFFEAWVQDRDLNSLQKKLHHYKELVKELKTRLKRAVKAHFEESDDTLRTLYSEYVQKYRTELEEAEEKARKLQAEVDLYKNQRQRLKEFEEFYLRRKERGGKIATVLKTSRAFRKFLYGLPFTEKKRLIEGVIAPEEGGKIYLRYLTPADVLSVEDVEKLPPEERNRPLPEMEPVVELDFTLDVNRVEALITGLNRNDLLTNISLG